MTKLNQIIAIEKGAKNQATRVVTDLYHDLEKKPLFAGLSRKYTPKDEEDGDKLPPERVDVQIKSADVIRQLIEAQTRLIDVTATKDNANTEARADVVVGNVVVLENVPVTTLMFLDKRLDDLTAFVGRIPILDPTNQWTYDSNIGVHRAAPVETVRTKKVPRNHVLSEATKEHPAQVQVFTEDVIVGTWEKTEFSGAMKADDVAAIKDRLEKLHTAVKYAREEANTREIADIEYGADFMKYLFEGGTQTSG